MKPENEDQRPFLGGYSDDPALSPSPGPDPEQTLKSKKSALRTNRLARDLLVFLIASLLWLGAIFFLLPWPSASSAAAEESSSANSNHHHNHSEEEFLNMQGDMSRFHNVTSGATFVSCGNSTAEAKAAGCHYDTLLNHWVPAQCVDQEWIDEYQDDGSWTAFSDVNLTQPLAPEDMGSRDHYYTSIRDHVNHCAMLWRKQFWTLFEARRVFDGVIVNTYHTEHCAEFLSDLMGMERTEPTLVRVGFSGCWVRGDEGEL